MRIFQVTIQGAVMIVRAESPESADRLARRRRRQQFAAGDPLGTSIGAAGPLVFTDANGARRRMGPPHGKESAVAEVSSSGPEEVVSVLVPRE